VKALGSKTAKVLAERLELDTVGDLLRHYPRRYAMRGELTDLTQLIEGEHVTVVAEVVRTRGRDMRARRGRLTEVEVTDGRGHLSLTFFGKVAYVAEKQLRPGVHAMFAGKVSLFNGRRQLVHPEHVLLSESDDVEDLAGRPIPIYPATKGLMSWQIAQCLAVVLDTRPVTEDPLPEAMRRDHSLIELAKAYEQVHRPRSDDEIPPARRRLKWDEAFVVQLALARRRRAATALPAKPRPLRVLDSGPAKRGSHPRLDGGGLLAEFEERLPFELTDGQRAVGAEIAADLERDHPMHRLLQGDVGAGKTVVALRAMLQVVDADGQSALLAPTEVLAQQHHRSILGMLGPLAQAGMLGGADHGTRVSLLTGSMGAKARKEALLSAASGEAGIVVGTHALLEEHVQFAELGLVVVDEQHRFGVEQRDALRAKAGDGRPHVLVMTATPIPRTVAMTVFGDLDTSALTELPAGRSPIATHVVPAGNARYWDRVWERVSEETGAGRQAYVVCPRIGAEDDHAKDDVAADAREQADGEGRRAPLAVLDVAPMLAEGPLRDLRVGILHGRLHPDEKDAAMSAFGAGELDVLVATTVIEVGVDVPNATAMVIMDADRFGVSQLHQLRGRVGRGKHAGLCLLVTDVTPDTKAFERLAAVAATTDGFELARLDLEQRREGDVLGEAQSGRRSSLRLLTLLRDEKLIMAAREEATSLIDADPELGGHPLLAAELDALVDEERAEYLEKA
jgi:ATP-dependent DNA helicase RecG